MLEKLIELAVSGWSHIAPFVVVDPYEGAGVLRLGKYDRTLENGFHWKWPLAERAVEITTCLTTMRLPPQSLTTKDGHSLVVSCVIKYEIKDVRAFITKIYDQKDALADTVMGAVSRYVRATGAGDILSGQPDKEIIAQVRDEVNQFGFKVHRITFVDLARAKSFRLLQASVTKDIDN